ncbi:MAG: CDP-glucose 4,6-dehydratase [Candidatus Didemnitutus sp.]|nr:CDP-glucose 4,6-dehydratase [Candidatus Didemnitutus sp.]
MSFADIYRGKRVLVTGHTGFKGSWLCEWLLSLGAEVTGLALPPPTEPSLFDQLRLAHRLRHVVGDIRSLAVVRRVIDEAKPDFVFHLAAQPLVRLSYREPVETYATNVMGTVHVLEAVRLAARPCTVVCITTDKCYENREWVHSYREEDPMGGYDPYSSSKGAAELVIAAYRRSYFSAADSLVRLASARAGNVIGGGDWALDRIVPDCIRALQASQAIPVRNKIATRPWQHVLEPLSGYLWLGACLASPALSPFGAQLCSGFNFGPALTSNRTVAELVQEILRHWPGQWVDQSDPHAVHEAKLLNLATDKAFHFLHWKPVWDFAATIAETVSWYRLAAAKPGEIEAATRRQIESYTAAARARGVAWSG